jgi:hypothetical protein
MAWCGYFVQKTFRLSLLPHGIPHIMRRIPQFATIDSKNALLQMQHGRSHKIVCTGGTSTHENEEDDTNNRTSSSMIRGPETIVFGKDDRMYIMTETAWLVEIILPNNNNTPKNNHPRSKQGDADTTANSTILPATCRMVQDLGNGRPLGGAFDRTGKYLYMADAILGLTRTVVAPTGPTHPIVEVLVSSVPEHGRSSSPSIRYCDDVAVGPKSGRIYFTDATTIAPDRVFYGENVQPPQQQHGEWDTLYASKLDFMRGYGTGRLLMYDPSAHETTVLIDRDQQIHFANGVAVDKDERYVVVAETFGLRIHRYDLQTHTSEVLIDSHQIPGYVDGMDCSKTSTICYAVMPSAILPIHKLLNAVHPSLSRYFRIFLSILPRKWTPPVKKFGGILEFNITAAPGNAMIRTILDPTGRDLSMLTGVTIHKDKLYLGSLTNPFVGVYDL